MSHTLLIKDTLNILDLNIYFEENCLTNIICQIKRDKTFHLRNSKKLLMVFGNLVIF